jgi:hypothetical protein
MYRTPQKLRREHALVSLVSPSNSTVEETGGEHRTAFYANTEIQLLLEFNLYSIICYKPTIH